VDAKLIKAFIHRTRSRDCAHARHLADQLEKNNPGAAA
jgi:hypothetical protein